MTATRTRPRTTTTTTTTRRADPEAWSIGLQLLEQDNDAGNLGRLQVHADGNVTVRNRPIKTAVVD